MSLRVLQVVDTLAPGGRERLVVDLANQHVVRGLNSHVCETRHRGELASELNQEVGHVVLARSRRLDLAAMARLARYVREHHIDVIHSHGRSVTQFAALVTVLFRLPAAHIFHDHMPGVDVHSPATIPLRFAVWLKVDAVISVSDDLRDWAIERLRFPTLRVWSILNGIDVERFASARPAELRSEFPSIVKGGLVVAVGNIKAQKDYKTLLRAFASLDIPASLLVVGTDHADASYAAQCRELANDLGIGGCVTFAGVRHDVPEILAAADIGVLASRAESGPLAVAEYAAAALPIIATATGPITAAVAEHPFATIVPVGDASAIAKTLMVLLSLTSTDRQYLGSRAQTFARRTFSIERMEGEVIAVYQAVGRRAPSKTPRPSRMGR